MPNFDVLFEKLGDERDDSVDIEYADVLDRAYYSKLDMTSPASEREKILIREFAVLYVNAEFYKDTLMEVRNENKLLRNELLKCQLNHTKCVYFIIEDPFQNRVKIGKANNATSRLKSLQTGCPNKLAIYKVILTDKPFELETKFTNS